MCGRFVSATPPDELARYFGAEAPAEQLLEPSYNVAPTATVFTVVERANDRAPDAEVSRQIETMHWGLLPIWAKEKKFGNRMFNARCETLAEKNSFKPAFRKRRCIIPVDGFYEWMVVPSDDVEAAEQTKKPKKQPVFIRRGDGDPFAFAGLWERWRGPDRDGELLESCTIITGSPNDKMAHYHHRMPVMLPPDAWDTWLDPSLDDLETLAEFFVPAPSELLEIHPVSTEVNNAR
ncbi:MAG: SOS response-associated peptidase, partial [Acidimicrobiales bacterium]